MDNSASIPGWVARRGWNRKNPAWVRRWLDRKPKAERSVARRDEPEAPSATILQFSRDRKSA